MSKSWGPPGSQPPGWRHALPAFRSPLVEGWSMWHIGNLGMSVWLLGLSHKTHSGFHLALSQITHSGASQMPCYEDSWVGLWRSLLGKKLWNTVCVRTPHLCSRAPAPLSLYFHGGSPAKLLPNFWPVGTMLDYVSCCFKLLNLEILCYVEIITNGVHTL